MESSVCSGSCSCSVFSGSGSSSISICFSINSSGIVHSGISSFIFPKVFKMRFSFSFASLCSNASFGSSTGSDFSSRLGSSLFVAVSNFFVSKSSVSAFSGSSISVSFFSVSGRISSGKRILLNP